jgi:hypothetical protein
LVGAVKLSTLIYVALFRDTFMLDFNYISGFIFKQIEIPLSWHRRINPTFIFRWTGQAHRLRPGVTLQSARGSQDVCISLQLDDSAGEVYFGIRYEAY